MSGRLQPEEQLRLMACRRVHPDWDISPAAFGAWEARIPLGGTTERIVVGEGFLRLMDKLDALEGPEDTG